MKMDNLSVGLCLILALTGSAYCTFSASKDGITIECENAVHRLASEPKTNFYVKCSTTGDVSDVIVGKMKTYGQIDQSVGTGTASTKNSDGSPYEVYNSTHIEPKLEELAPGRYTVQTDATSVTVTVSDAQAEDSGLWVCGTTNMTVADFEASTTCNIYVVGGVQNITINDASDDIILEPETTTTPMEIKVKMANVLQDKIEILIAGEDVTADFTTGSPLQETTIYDGGYTTYLDTYTYAGTFTVTDDTKNTAVEVKVHMSPVGGITTKSFNVFSKGLPYNVKCGSVTRGATEATITCEGYMYPVGNVTWSTPQGGDMTVSQVVVQEGNRTLENTITNALVVSTLTIDADADADVDGTYQATFANEYGQVSDSHNQDSTAGGFVTKAALPLVVMIVLMNLLI